MRNKSYAAIAWLQLVTSLLLASAIVWGYMNYQASFGQFLRSVAASIVAVSNVVGRTAETVDVRRDMVDQTAKMLVVTRNLVNELRVAAERQRKLGPQYAAGLHSASVAIEKLGNSMESLGDSVSRFSDKNGQKLKDFSHNLKEVSATLSIGSDELIRDANNISAAFIKTRTYALTKAVKYDRQLKLLFL